MTGFGARLRDGRMATVQLGLAVVLLWGASGVARADDQVLPSQRWHTPMDGLGLARTQSGRLLGHLVLDVGVSGGYERNPLVVTDRAQNAPGPWSDARNPLGQYNPFHRRVASLLTDRLSTEATVSLGLFDWVQLYAALPVTLWQQRGEGISQATTPFGPVNEFNLGDLRFGGKVRLLRGEDFFLLPDVAVVAQLMVPVGLGFHLVTVDGFVPRFNPGTAGWAQGYTSEGFPSLITELAISRELFGVFAGVNAGVRLRRPYELLQLTISHEAVVRAGLGFKGRSLARHLAFMRFLPVEAGVEAQASNALIHPYVSVPFVTPGAGNAVSVRTPPLRDFIQPSLEVSAFVGLDVLGIHPYVGGGLGVLSTWGTPDWRIMGGLRVVPTELLDAVRSGKAKDRDGDGVADPQDACPADAGETALKGCPDGDRDGVADREDRCPWEPRGGVDDADGCPHAALAAAQEEPQRPAPDEPDGDNDGVPDGRDPCPRRAEDVDGFADEDGCPEPDNDGDDVADARDACPLEAEVVNGVDDADGCPDTDPSPDAFDPDHDSISSDEDRCPFEAGPAPDGCPRFSSAAAAPPASAPVVAAVVPPPPPPPSGELLPPPPPPPPSRRTRGKTAEPVEAPPPPPGTALVADPTSDHDADGIPDPEDRCPQRAEDGDGFQDEDGCPDPDNDGDGVPDTSDGCALAAEDLDGNADDDGCPEDEPTPAPVGDGDNDGLADDVDRCPFEPEDANGTRDDDGCPEGVALARAPVAPAPQPTPVEAPAPPPDLDHDGLPDFEDACPARPEDPDGYADEDGCPDRDDDNDAIADDADRCPMEAETANGWQDDDGCPDADPDADGDGIADALDRCPHEAEDINKQRDDDGCPDESVRLASAPGTLNAPPYASVGVWSLEASPAVLTAASTPLLASVPWTAGDADGDLIANGADACPRRAEDTDGFSDEDGCPDEDNDSDGIPDAKDRCVLESETFNGNQDLDGCPDLDGDQDKDGVLDGLDRCPLEAEDKNGDRDDDGCPDVPVVLVAARNPDKAPGVVARPKPADIKREAALPWTAGDSDGDKIPNAVDPCPRAGEDKDKWADEDGCPEPDNDHDGVPDKADRCPREAEVINGVKDTDGCPDVGASSVSMTGDHVEIEEKVYFSYGTAALSPRSFGLLKQMAALLRAYPNVRIRVEGHTDSSGPERRNEKLSEQRATAVVRFLVKQGIAARRLRAVGFGPFRPLESNDTPEGKEANRRVEFVVEE
jgi:outer membrane protein OmpA-like peptidoglycan-associated protein